MKEEHAFIRLGLYGAACFSAGHLLAAESPADSTAVSSNSAPALILSAPSVNRPRNAAVNRIGAPQSPPPSLGPPATVGFAPEETGAQASTSKPRRNRGQEFKEARHRMVMEQLVSSGRGISNPKLIEAMKQVERHNFIPPDRLDQAYEDQTVDIGFGLTVEQPYVVASMLQNLNPGENDRVLEIGTGSGYQAAVLSQLVKEVYTVEELPVLADRASVDLQRAGCTNNVFVRTGLLSEGWPSAAPFDAIIVNSGSEELAQALTDQLKEKGRLILPAEAGNKLHIKQKRGAQFVSIKEQPLRPSR